MTPIEFFKALAEMPSESYLFIIPVLILIVIFMIGEKFFVYLFITVICFIIYIFKQQIDMDLDLLKEKQKNESKKIDNKFEEIDNKIDELYNKIDELNNKIDELSEKNYLLSEEIQQRFQEEDTLANYSRRLSSSSSSRVSRRTSDELMQKFKKLFNETMREKNHTKSDMINEVVADLKRETGIKVLGFRAIENYYNGTTKPDTKSIDLIKAWIAFKTKEKNKVIVSNNNNDNSNDDEEIYFNNGNQ